jgi:SAM-dependent methyltransferase
VSEGRGEAKKMNQERHWNTIGERYKDEIFDVFTNDKNQVLQRYFKKYANSKHTAIDFGCGIGKAFSYLCPLFGKVIGTDISSKLLAQAKKQPFKNIEIIKADLAKPSKPFTPASFAFCCNVIMLPEADKNAGIFRTIQQSLKKEGRAIIVIPSIESMMFSSWRLIDWYKQEGVEAKAISSSELNYFKGSKRDLVQGKVYIDGVPTKHYSREELEVITQKAGLTITAIEKIEYNWDTEFAEPPAWMGAPYPWDWMIECRKS